MTYSTSKYVVGSSGESIYNPLALPVWRAIYASLSARETAG